MGCADAEGAGAMTTETIAMILAVSFILAMAFVASLVMGIE